MQVEDNLFVSPPCQRKLNTTLSFSFTKHVRITLKILSPKINMLIIAISRHKKLSTSVPNGEPLVPLW